MKNSLIIVFISLISIKGYSQTKEDYMSAAISLVKANDYIGAIQYYDMIIKMDSLYVDAYNNRGNAKMKLEDYNGAIDDYTIAISLASDYNDAYYNRDRKSTRLNSSHSDRSRMPSSA